MADDLNVLGETLEPCGMDPVTGFFRDGCCSTGPEDVGSHTVCAVMTAEFLAHQERVGNPLATPRPQYRFPGLKPGDRWCVVAMRWLQAHQDGAAAPIAVGKRPLAAMLGLRMRRRLNLKLNASVNAFSWKMPTRMT